MSYTQSKNEELFQLNLLFRAKKFCAHPCLRFIVNLSIKIKIKCCSSPSASTRTDLANFFIYFKRPHMLFTGKNPDKLPGKFGKNYKCFFPWSFTYELADHMREFTEIRRTRWESFAGQSAVDRRESLRTEIEGSSFTDYNESVKFWPYSIVI